MCLTVNVLERKVRDNRVHNERGIRGNWDILNFSSFSSSFNIISHLGELLLLTLFILHIIPLDPWHSVKLSLVPSCLGRPPARARRHVCQPVLGAEVPLSARATVTHVEMNELVSESRNKYTKAKVQGVLRTLLYANTLLYTLTITYSLKHLNTSWN